MSSRVKSKMDGARLSDMSALLDHHLYLAHHRANCDAALFFGPVKEQLWVVVDVEYRQPGVHWAERSRVPAFVAEQGCSLHIGTGVVAEALVHI